MVASKFHQASLRSLLRGILISNEISVWVYCRLLDWSQPVGSSLIFWTRWVCNHKKQVAQFGYLFKTELLSFGLSLYFSLKWKLRSEDEHPSQSLLRPPRVELGAWGPKSYLSFQIPIANAEIIDIQAVKGNATFCTLKQFSRTHHDC